MRKNQLNLEKLIQEVMGESKKEVDKNSAEGKLLECMKQHVALVQKHLNGDLSADTAKRKIDALKEQMRQLKSGLNPEVYWWC